MKNHLLNKKNTWRISCHQVDNPKRNMLLHQITRTILVSLFLFVLQSSGKLMAQTVSLNFKKESLEKVLEEIKKQTKYDFAYNEDILKSAIPITIEVQNHPLEAALKKIFQNQPLSYKIAEGIIIIKQIEDKKPAPPPDIEAQKQEHLTGKVTDDKGVPLGNVTVKVQSSNLSTQTDENGYYVLPNTPLGSTLLFQHIGWESLKIQAEAPYNLTILSSKNIHLDSVLVEVNTGYQTLPKERATGSFVVINKELIDRRVSTNILDRLDGVTSGLLFSSPSLKATTVGSIEIHGRSTLFANAEPLVILDNFPYEGSLSDINPNDIENITILKDAAAASIWGARAGNGVIVVTSKKGVYNMAPKVQINSNLTVGGKPDLFYQKQLTSAEFIGIEQFLFNKGFYNNTINSEYGILSPAVEIFLNRKNELISSADSLTLITELASHDTRDDYKKYFYRNSINQQYQANISGGSKTQRYFISTGYDKNLSNSIGNSFDRLTINANNNYSLLQNKLDIGSNIFYVSSSNVIQNSHLRNTYPYERIADKDGNPLAIVNNLRLSYIESLSDTKLLDWYYRPLEELREGYSSNRTNNANYRINFSAKYKIYDGLSVSAMYNFDKGNAENSIYNELNSFNVRDLINSFSQINEDGTVNYPLPVGGIVHYNDMVSKSHGGRTQLNYDLKKGKHELYTLIGTEIKDISTVAKSQTMYGYKPETSTNQNASIDYLEEYPNFYSGSTSRIENGSYESRSTNRYLSYYFNGSYAYLSRYQLSFSARRDESNLFGVKANQKGVPLWSTGFVWNTSDEDFYNFKWLPVLKAGITFGYTGNVDNSLSAYLIANQSSAFLNNYGNLYSEILNPPNPALRWEKVQNMNLNLEFASKNNIIKGRIDYWTKKGLDLIGNSPIAPQTGVTLFKGNSANTSARGIDVQLQAKIVDNSLKWNAVLLYNHVNSKVTDYKVKSGTNLDIVSAIYNNPIVGYPQFSVFSFAYAGLDETGNPIGYLDGNESQEYAKIINSADRNSLIYNGSAVPTSFGSIRNNFSYKNFELSFNITYKLGYYFRRRSISSSVYNNGWRSPDYGKQWQNPGDEKYTDIPALLYPRNGNRDNLYTYSSSLVEKADHIRLQDIRLAYNAKIPIGNTAKNFNFFMYMNNLAILWRANNKDIDPDYTVGYPNPRTLAFGFKADL